MDERQIRRFWSNVQVRNVDECWDWKGSVRGRYGQFCLSHTESRQAHRLTWELCNGEIPEDTWVRHSCTSDLCCNPSHLYLHRREFWPNVDMGGDDDCWPWRGYERNGTCIYSIRGKDLSPFRFAWEYMHGVIPKSVRIRHTCHTKGCCNPKHMYRSDDSVSSFWERVDVRGPDECWEWQGYRKPFGHGTFFFNGKMDGAHRISWSLANGPIQERDDGQEVCVCHHCDNPPCCNPKHLFLGTHADNNRDRDRKGRTVYSPARGEDAGGAKLTEDDVREIRSIVGVKQRDIAKMYSVSQSVISGIITRQRWAHVE